jgi:hypothetical protein
LNKTKGSANKFKFVVLVEKLILLSMAPQLANAALTVEEDSNEEGEK